MKFKNVTHPEMGYKFCKFCATRARDTLLRGVCISHFGQITVKISVKNSVWGSCTLIVPPTGWNLAWRKPLIRVKF